MATAWETFPIKFEGGLIDNLGRLEQGTQAPGSATILQNFENSVEGGYSKILGYSKFSETAVTGTGQVVGVISAGSNKVIATRTGKYYVSTGTTWAEKATAANTSFTRIRFDRYNFDGTNKIVIVDGINDPLIYNASDDSMTYDTDANVDAVGASFVRVFKNHVFFGKNNLLTFTAPYTDGDFNTGNGAGAINVGSTITGLIVFREQLIIFSVDRIQRLVGNTSEDFVLQPITLNTGCLSGDTIQEVGGDILYLGPDGIRFLSATEKNEDFALDLASRKISDNLSTFIGRTATYASLVIPSKSQYRIFSYNSSLVKEASEGYSATLFSDQSVDRIGWSKLIGMKVYAADNKRYVDKEVILFCSDTGYVYLMETGSSFDGDPIPCIFETPFFPINDPRVRKTLYKHTLYANLNGLFNLEVAIKLDYRVRGIIQPPSFFLDAADSSAAIYGDPSAIYGTSIYGRTTQSLFVSLVEGSAFTFAVRYEDTSTNPSFILDYVVLEHTNNERR